MILTPTQQTVAQFVVEDANGNPAQFQGPAQWASADPNVASVVPSADGTTATFSAGRTGRTQVSVTVDADLGEGVEPLVGIGEIEVLSGRATVVRLTFGPATER